MNDKFKLIHIKGKGNKRNFLIEYLKSIGVNVEVVEISEGITGMKASYVIIDEWVKEGTDEH